MLVSDIPQAQLITRTGALAELARQLAGEERVAVDTESNSLHAYREQVCLVQLSTPKADYLIDPLVVDLAPLGDFFASPKTEKVFHAAEYDLVCLRRDYGFEFSHLFDTMLAARALGRAELGLGAILAGEFGVELVDLKTKERHQRANWGMRPLPEAMLAYAQMDTHYLLPLRERMLAALQERGLNELVDEDCKRIIRQTRLQNGNQPDDMLGAWRQVDVWRVKGAQDLEAQQSAVLQELCIYRDQVARAEDRPWFKVIGDATLLEVARRAPQTMDELRRIHGMTTGQVRRHGKGLLEAVRQGLQAPPLYPRRKPRPDEAYLHRLDALRRWRKAAGERMGVGSDVILPRDLMETLADKNPADEPQLREFMDCYPWRLQRFGGEILNAMRKKS